MDAKTFQRKNRSWWNSNPMTYDWHKTLRLEEGTPEFFKAMDRRFLQAHFFAQRPGEPIFGELIPYTELRGKRVVEVGCGAGAITAEFARQGARVCGVDMAERSVGLTSVRLRASRLPDAVVQGDAENLPFCTDSVDYVWSWGVLHHTHDTEKAVREVWRILRPGGTAAVMLYNKSSFRYWVHLLLLRGVLMGKLLSMSVQDVVTQYTDGAVARHYTKSEATRLFSRFKNVRMRLFGLKSELLPIPASPLKDAMVRNLPDSAAQSLLGKVGWFLFVECEK